MKHYPHKHTFSSTSSADNSDLEDMYGGFDTDDIPPSSDSEIVSHPSDNEDHARSLSASPAPGEYPRTDDNDGHLDHSDDENQVLPSLSVSSQDFDRRLSQRRKRESLRVQDDFFLVGPSDLEEMSRPQSSLSLHSDQSHADDPMHFIYPSMALSSSSSEVPPLHNDESQERAAGKSPVPQEQSHVPSAHDIPVDSSLETLSGPLQLSTAELQKLSTNVELYKDHADVGEDMPLQDSVEDPTPLSRTVEFLPVLILAEGEGDAEKKIISLSEPAPALVAHLSPPTLDAPEAVEAPNDSNTPGAASTGTVKTVLDRLSQAHSTPSSGTSGTVISPSWRLLNVVARCIGFLSLFICTGFLYAEYHHRSVVPAHVVLSKINYSPGQLPLAYGWLSVYTSRLNEKRFSNRPPGFHIRVLDDNKPWSLEEAPAQPLDLFAEPILSCSWSGDCLLYIPSSSQRITQKGLSPRVCADKLYYLHIWFANGTRALDPPPEILTSPGGKPASCFTEPPFAGFREDNEDEENDDYLAYWRERLEQMTSKVACRYSSVSASWTDMQWDRLLPAITEVRSIAEMTIEYYQRSARMLIDTVLQWKNRLLKIEDQVLDRTTAAFSRARRNAKKITSQASLRAQQAADQIQRQTTFRSRQQQKKQQQKQQSGQQQPSTPVEQHVRTLKNSLKDQLKKLSSNRMVRKVDQILANMEENLESLANSKTGKKISKTLRADEIQRKAEEFVRETDAMIDRMLESEFAQGVQREVQQTLDRFKATPAGGKLVQEAQAITKDVKRRWKDLQRELRVVG